MVAPFLCELVKFGNFGGLLTHKLSYSCTKTEQGLGKFSERIKK